MSTTPSHLHIAQAWFDAFSLSVGVPPTENRVGWWDTNQ